MQIRMLATAAGPNGVYLIGSQLDLPDKQAQDFVNNGYAVSLEREQPDITAREMAINPKAATRGTRKAK